MIRRTVMLLIGLVFLLSTVDARAPIVINVRECGLLASDGSVFMSTGKEVIKENNRITITCSGIQPAGVPLPGRAMHFDYASTDIAYLTEYGMIQEWIELIKPDGRVTLEVKINSNTKP